ncbi:hypothetical protein V8C86DRAFT_2694997 [Haematococcus lacustris]
MWPMVASTPPAAALSCPGERGYALQRCLKKEREAREQAAVQAGESPLSIEDEKLRTRQYEQPGTLVTLPSGVQYRELDPGQGPRAAQYGDTLEVQYTVYRLASGAYFKYSSGGTPVLLWALGSGFEGADDLDTTYRFKLGEPLTLPAAAPPAVEGMRAGGRRCILVPPAAGWVDARVGPPPTSFGASRRLAAHRDEALLLEIVLLRVSPGSVDTTNVLPEVMRAGQPLYRLPEPPSPFRQQYKAQ